MAWNDALTLNRVWDQQADTPRIRKAFQIIAAEHKRWPLPKTLLEEMPPRAELPALPTKPSDPERAKRIIAELAKELGVNSTHRSTGDVDS